MKLSVLFSFVLMIIVLSCKNQKSPDLKYIFSNYEEIGSKTYFNLSVSGEGGNKKLTVLVNDWNKLEGIRRTKGIGYRGAVLKGLKLEAINDANANFAYKNLDAILD